MFAVKLTILYFTIMIKSILNLEGVQSLSKETQKEVNGGKTGSSGFGACSVVCQSGSGGYCGPSHCPAVCTGPGQWVYL